VDTPCFDRYDAAEAFQDLKNYLVACCSKGGKPIGIIYLFPITNRQFREISELNLRVMKKLFKDGGFVLATTKWDNLRNEEIEAGLESEMELIKSPGLWGDMVNNGSTVARFDGTSERALAIIQSLSIKTLTTLKIQTELLDDQLHLGDTQAGQEALRDLRSVKSWYQKEIGQLKVEMNESWNRWISDAHAAMTIVQDQINALKSRSSESDPERSSSQLGRQDFEIPQRELEGQMPLHGELLGVAGTASDEVLSTRDLPAVQPSSLSAEYRAPLPFSAPNSNVDSTGTFYSQTTSATQQVQAKSTLPTTLFADKIGENEDTYDSQTVFTDNLSLALPDNAKGYLIHIIAEQLFQHFESFQGAKEGSATRISAALPALLKEFSQEVSSSASSRNHRDAVTFVRHYRRCVVCVSFSIWKA
jgi:hypothetical protein